jgi:outer membrane lipoprotein-sorting protein
MEESKRIRFTLRTGASAPDLHFTSVILSALVSVLVAIAGCGGGTSNFQLSPADAETLNPILKKLQARYELTATLKTSMRVTIEEDGEKEEVREYLWYKKSVKDGELLHIQAMGPFDEPRVVTIAARKKFLLRFINEQEAYFEPLENGVLGEIFGVDLRVSDVRSAIFANPFLDKRTEELALRHSGAKYVVNRPGTKAGQVEEITIFVRDEEPEIREWIIRDNSGTVVQRAKFSDYREVSFILYSHKVEIERPIEQTRVVFRIVKPQINIEVSDKKFDFEPFLGPDIKIRSLKK